MDELEASDNARISLVSITERIARAGNSKNLRQVTREGSAVSDADVLIACGWTKSKLGRSIAALMSEWDGIGKPLSLTEYEAAFMISGLKSIDKVFPVLDAWAERKGLPDKRRLVPAVLCHYLDNTCATCYGRGRTLIPDTPSLGDNCGQCHGTGKRREPGGEAGRRMLGFMADCHERALQSIARRLTV